MDTLSYQSYFTYNVLKIALWHTLYKTIALCMPEKCTFLGNIITISLLYISVQKKTYYLSKFLQRVNFSSPTVNISLKWNSPFPPGMELWSRCNIHFVCMSNVAKLLGSDYIKNRIRSFCMTRGFPGLRDINIT